MIDDDRFCRKIIAALGLPETATGEEIESRISFLRRVEQAGVFIPAKDFAELEAAVERAQQAQNELAAVATFWCRAYLALTGASPTTKSEPQSPSTLH
jgi:hypothetical protein